MFLPANDCPDDKYLNKYVREKICAAGTNKWRDLGIELMEQDAIPSLDVISANHTNNVECCTRMFTEWRQRTPKASWKQLIGALKEVQLTQLASELEELLIPSVEKQEQLDKQLKGIAIVLVRVLYGVQWSNVLSVLLLSNFTGLALECTIKTDWIIGLRSVQ